MPCDSDACLSDELFFRKTVLRTSEAIKQFDASPRCGHSVCMPYDSMKVLVSHGGGLIPSNTDPCTHVVMMDIIGWFHD